MANMNIRTPRFYVDTISYLMSRGVAQDGEFDVLATDGAAYKIGLQTGTEAELFDMKPLNKCTFDTSADPDGHVMITIDLGPAGSLFKTSYIAILNHNLKNAVGKIRIFAGDESTDVTAVDGANAETGDINWGSVTTAEVVNADTITAGSDNKSVVIEPADTGSTIVKFDEIALRYWCIQFEGNTTNTGNATNGTWGSTDLYVGGVMIVEAYSMPQAPDLNVKRSIMFDKVKIQESVGGQRYSNMTSFGRQSQEISDITHSPFSTSSYFYTGYGGRIAYDMNFSYLNSTDVMPNEYKSVQYADDAVIEDVWNKTNGRHLPFIFSIDKDSEGADAESEHIFARFGQNSLDMTQVANDMFNISMRIVEEF